VPGLVVWNGDAVQSAVITCLSWTLAEEGWPTRWMKVGKSGEITAQVTARLLAGSTLVRLGVECRRGGRSNVKNPMMERVTPTTVRRG